MSWGQQWGSYTPRGSVGNVQSQVCWPHGPTTSSLWVEARVLPDHLRDTDQPSADHLVWPWGPSTSTPETKAKPETAEPWGRLVPST